MCAQKLTASQLSLAYDSKNRFQVRVRGANPEARSLWWGEDLWNRRVSRLDWKSEEVMDDKIGEWTEENDRYRKGKISDRETNMRLT